MAIRLKIKIALARILKNNFNLVKFREKLFNENFIKLSYSQEGEDRILDRLFNYKNNGFYIDVGAHHPFLISNTAIFYERGWRGINIDALPSSKSLFEQYRPDDTNLNIGVSNSEAELTYYMFNDAALNTFSSVEAEKKHGWKGKYFIENQIKIRTKKLSTIFRENILENKEIDFLNVDVEGLDLEVLESNDWNVYKPKIVLVEELRAGIETIISSSAIYKFLSSKGYVLYCKSHNSSFYIREDKFQELMDFEKSSII